VYINVIKDDAPEVLTLNTVDTSQPMMADAMTDTGDSVAGEWAIAEDSVVGYRVKEILFGQSTEGVGRTNSVSGSLTIDDDVVMSATFEVAMATLKSDSDRRDRQVNNRILDTSTYPTAMFRLTSPISLTPEALAGAEFSVTADGELTLRGVTKAVSVDLVARLVDGLIEVNGQIEIVFSDWQIPDPSVSGISVEPSGLLEFLLRFTLA
jgi:polyisoprenoid-binding protein YceI